MIWNGPKPTYGTIIALFIPTSMFYSHYKYFNDAVKHLEMLEWLEERQNGPFFGHRHLGNGEKSIYISDLIKWLKQAISGTDFSSDDNGKS